MYCISCGFDLRGLPANTCPECGRAFDPADATSFLRFPVSNGWVLAKRIFGIGLILFIVAAIAAGGMFLWGVRNAMVAEERLQAIRVVCDLIAEHVERSPSHTWPTSWADLERLPPREEIWKWPEEAAKYKAIITIDFTATTANVLKQSPRTCTAVTLSPGPNFAGSPGLELQGLFDRLQALPKPAGTE